METLIVVVHVLAALGVTGLVLIQHGKGADMGASFGSGASQTIFGSVGSGNALTKSTTWLATVFFITSLVLALFAKQQAGQGIEDSILIENPDQLDIEVQQDSDVPVAVDAPPSDVPALPPTESQVELNADVPQVQQQEIQQQEVQQQEVQQQEVQQEVQQQPDQEAGTETAPAAEPATTQDGVEETAEDLQNATEN